MKKQAAPLQDMRWHRSHIAADMHKTVAEKITTLANACISFKGSFHIVLAGGNTPRDIYRLLRNSQTDWQHWHVYFGDERCWPKNHSGRNDTMAYEAFLAHVPIPREQIHPIPAELPPAECVQHYTAIVSSIAVFDLVLLGLGEDGHTASLFPGHAWGKDAGSLPVMSVVRAPAEPPQRISLSARRLSETDNVWLLVSGKNKEAILLRWQEGEFLPISVIQPPNGIDIFVAP